MFRSGTSVLRIFPVVLLILTTMQLSVDAAVATTDPGVIGVGTATFTPPKKPADAAREGDAVVQPHSAHTGTLAVSPSSLSFGSKRVGVYSVPLRVTVSNSAGSDLFVDEPDITGVHANQFTFLGGSSTCGAYQDVNGVQTWTPTAVPAGNTCLIDVSALPLTQGLNTASLDLTVYGGSQPTSIPLTVSGDYGYYVATATGQIGGYGNTNDQRANLTGLVKPIVALDTTTNGEGVWRAGADGGVFASGTAKFFGGHGGSPLNQPIVGIAQTGFDNGYWLVASDGGVFTYGDAHYWGSKGGEPLNKPIVGMAATPSGQGYWLVASDGGVFSFGDAGFYGSKGGSPLNSPVVGITATSDGKGYWLVAADGGVFAFGNANFYGSAGGTRINAPVVGMEPSAFGEGYWLVGRDGGVFAYGDAPFVGSAGGVPGINDVVGIAASSPQIYLVSP